MRILSRFRHTWHNVGMGFLNILREKISPQNPLLFLYHKCLVVAAAIFYRFPARRMKIVAVTGTKGKSTTVYLLASILKAAGLKVGAAGTIQFQIGERVWVNETKQTTQGRFTLQRLLRRMADAKCNVAILEVTSHALVQSRLFGVPVHTAVLTNIQRDHLEYHGGFEPYVAAKAKLFALPPENAVLPAEEKELRHFENSLSARKIFYGITKGDVRAVDISHDSGTVLFMLRAPEGQEKICLHLPGEFNIRNALAAASAAISLGVRLGKIKEGLESVCSIPGRMEEIRVNKNQPAVFVDYAHTPESLEAALDVCKKIANKNHGKLFLVFGATGGGRDKAKRPEMGKVAARFADEIFVTDDDPYTEDRAGIIEQVAVGTGRREGEGLWKILGRREAIVLVLSRASRHDAVLIAGKGCEPIQIIGHQKIPWDDREVVREILTAQK